MKLSKIKLMEGKLICQTGLHIGGGEGGMHIGGTDTPVIKTIGKESEPYIPGSSLKGKMRSLLELYQGNEYDETISVLFGEKVGDTTSNRLYKAGMLSFWDCYLTPEWKKEIRDNDLPYTEVKMENTIDRRTGTAQHPRNIERVIAGSVFHFKLSIKEFGDKNYDNFILTGLKLLENDCLGGSGSRGYGKIQFKELSIDGQSVQERYEKINLF